MNYFSVKQQNDALARKKKYILIMTLTAVLAVALFVCGFVWKLALLFFIAPFVGASVIFFVASAFYMPLKDEMDMLRRVLTMEPLTETGVYGGVVERNVEGDGALFDEHLFYVKSRKGDMSDERKVRSMYGVAAFDENKTYNFSTVSNILVWSERID